MPLSKHGRLEPRKIWSAVVVLAAVASLTVSLATRYYAPWDASSGTVKTVRTHAPDAKRQRLTKNAAIWMPPVFGFTVSQVPSFHPGIVPVGARVRNLVCDESLYNRPPPAHKFLS
jgi:hypothetical protein